LPGCRRAQATRASPVRCAPTIDPPASSVEWENALQTRPNAPGIASVTPRPSPSSTSKTPPGASAHTKRSRTSLRCAMCKSTNLVCTKSNWPSGRLPVTRST
jgi:hypothetical protein